jgi:hypothetical protein
MKTPLRPSTPPHNCPFLHHFSSAIKNWHVKHKRGKVDSAPLSLPRTAICFSNSRLPRCHSNRFVSFERDSNHNTSALLSSRCCAISWMPRLSRYPPLFLEFFSRHVETPTRHYSPAIPSSFDHPSAVVLRHPPEPGYKTSFSCTAVMDMAVSSAGVTDESPGVLIPTECCDSVPSSESCHMHGCFSYRNKRLVPWDGPLTERMARARSAQGCKISF